MDQAAADVSLWKEIHERSKLRQAQINSKVCLNVGGKIFSILMTVLLRFPVTLFSVMLSTEIWTPEADGGDGVYFFDRNPHVMDHVLDYMANGFIRTEILTPEDLWSLKGDLDFFQIPYAEDQNSKVLRPPFDDSVSEHDKSPYFNALSDMLEHLGSSSFQLPERFPQASITASCASILDKCLRLSSSLFISSREATEGIRKWRGLEETVRMLAEASKEQVNLDFRGRIFATCKSTLMKTQWFEAMVSRWQPAADSGAYFIDRNPRFVDIILEFLRQGSWNPARLDPKLKPEFEKELEFFGIENFLPKPPPASVQKQTILTMMHEFQGQGLVVGCQYAMLSAKWWRSWKLQCGYDSVLDQAAKLGPIDNSLLLETVDGKSVPMKTLSEMWDYEIVPESVYDRLVYWFGGGPKILGPALRDYKQQVFVEFRKLQLLVRKSSDMKTEVSVWFSRTATVEEFAVAMCQKLGILREKVRVWDFHAGTRHVLLEDTTKTLEQSRIIDMNKMLIEERDAHGRFP
eukprot:TRINITY_DN2328_c0_g1_i1.p2 TRINITY_DN2328_c0_g1~~TRINITY_DN2328_c0_g1_i1.p2  ORF type:complete len:518 (-),score=72.40 TRINITY_DN2328_c0_g1_i1:1026-2579(-)